MNTSLKFSSIKRRSSLLYGISLGILTVIVLGIFFLLNLHVLIYRLIHASLGIYVIVAAFFAIIIGRFLWRSFIGIYSKFQKNRLTDAVLGSPSEIKAYSDCLVFTENNQISKFYFTDITKITAVYTHRGVQTITIAEDKKISRIELAMFTMASDDLFNFLKHALPDNVFISHKTIKILGDWKNSAFVFTKHNATHKFIWNKHALKLIFIILLTSLLLGMMVWRFNPLNTYIDYEDDQPYERSSYHNLDGKLYYNGYESLNYEIISNADVDTFKLFSLPDKTYSLHMGYDDTGVYYHNQFMPLNNPADITYLGSNYWIYQEDVYYALTKIDNADMASFKPVNHQNNFLNDIYYYASDNQHVYYEGHAIEGISPHNLKTLDEDYLHLLGDDFVCYKQYLLNKMSPNITHYTCLNNGANFITDNNHFAINQQLLTGKVGNYFFGNTSVDDASLKLLMTLPNGSIPVLLADNHHLYYYDHKVNQFICRQDITGLTPFKDYLISDGSYIYYTETKQGNKRRSGNHGLYVSLYKSPLNAEKLIQIYSDENIDVYNYAHTMYALIKYNSNPIYLKNSTDITHLPCFVKVNNPVALKALTDDDANTSNVKPEWFTSIENSEKILDIHVPFN